MDIARTVELAVHVSRNCDYVIENSGALPEQALRDFWKYSRRRITDWKISLNQSLVRLHHASGPSRPARSRELESLIAELLVSDVLIRLWSAVLAAVDARRGTHWAEPIARHVLIDHLQGRYLALQALVDDPQLSQPRILKLNQLRHSAERWTNVLLGRLVCRWDLGDFAYDEAQARDFGESHLAHRDAATSDTAWHLMLTGVRLTFSTCPPNSPWRMACLRKIVGSIIGSFPEHTLFQRGTASRLTAGD